MTTSPTPPRAAVGLSRFSYVGRHVGGLSTMLSLAGRGGRMRLALLGSGPFEPILVAALCASDATHSRGEILAVDSSPEMTGLLETLTAGLAVPIGQLEESCRDNYIDGPSSNSNFSTKWNACIDALQLFVESPFEISDGGLRARTPSPNWQVMAKTCDALDFLTNIDDSSLDFVYCGMLFTNLRKCSTAASPVRVLAEAQRVVRHHGWIGVGGSLSPIHGVHRDLGDIAEAGLVAQYVSLENATLSGGELFADYGVGVAATAHSLASAFRITTTALVATPSYREQTGVSDTTLLEVASASDELLAGAVRDGRAWRVATVALSDLCSLIEPESRVTLDTVRFLRAPAEVTQ